MSSQRGVGLVLKAMGATYSGSACGRTPHFSVRESVAVALVGAFGRRVESGLGTGQPMSTQPPQRRDAGNGPSPVPTIQTQQPASVPSAAGLAEARAMGGALVYWHARISRG